MIFRSLACEKFIQLSTRLPRLNTNNDSLNYAAVSVLHIRLLLSTKLKERNLSKDVSGEAGDTSEERGASEASGSASGDRGLRDARNVY